MSIRKGGSRGLRQDDSMVSEQGSHRIIGYDLLNEYINKTLERLRLEDYDGQSGVDSSNQDHQDDGNHEQTKGFSDDMQQCIDISDVVLDRCRNGDIEPLAVQSFLQDLIRGLNTLLINDESIDENTRNTLINYGKTRDH